MILEKQNNNIRVQVILNNINLAILFSKRPHVTKALNDPSKGVFGFTNKEAELITKAIRKGVNIADKLDKYVFSVSGGDFLNNTHLKNQFLNELNA